jgi:hypothetical protein
MKTLTTFVLDKSLHNDVYNYIIKSFEDDILKQAFDGQDVTYMKHARLAIDTAFAKMKKEYSPDFKKPFVNQNK